MKIQLTEKQIKNLMGGYRTTITEQFSKNSDRNVPNTNLTAFNPQTKKQTINFGSVWPSGKWKLTQQQKSKIDPELRKIATFLIKYPASKLTIQIEAGESKVTNYDNEQASRVKVKPGYLSDKRGQEMAKHIGGFFKSLQSSGKIGDVPNIPKPKTIIGSSSYTSGVDDPKDPKYTKEQFVRLVVSAETKLKCLIGMKITIGYDKGGGHKCDEAIFDFRVNGVSLGVANLNNGQGDTAPVTKFRFDLKGRIDNYNKSITEREINKRASAELNIFRKDRSGYKYKDLTIDQMRDELETLPRNASPYNIMKSYFRKEMLDNGDPRLVIFNRSNDFTQEDYNKFRKHYGKKSNILPHIEKYIGTNMGDAVQKRDFYNSIQNIKGRYTDGYAGGSRSQTYTLDTNKAKEIVAKSPEKNRLVLSIVPLVDKTGPYSELYREGSHSSVPFVEIIDGNGKKVFPKDTPNVSMRRGDTSETPILKTDLCGKEIV